MRCNAPKVARRAGWAWVVVDDSGDVIFGLYGPCADPFPTAFKAELRAVCELLVVVVPPITIWIDNKEVLDGIAKGKQWCCASARAAADLWRTFWHKLEDIGGEGIDFVKTKGHATEADVQAGRSTAFQRRGNANADHYAGRGVDAAVSQSPNALAISGYKEATSWYKWLTLLCGSWPKDTDPKPLVRSISAPAAKRKAKRASCEASGPASAASSGAAAVPVEPGNVVTGSLPAELTCSKQLHSSHCLRLTGSLIWCNHCGCYGQARFKALQQACRGNETAKARAGQLARLRLGRHPITGDDLGKVFADGADAKQLDLLGSRSEVGSIPTGAGKRLHDALCRPVLRALGLALGRLA